MVGRVLEQRIKQVSIVNQLLWAAPPERHNLTADTYLSPAVRNIVVHSTEIGIPHPRLEHLPQLDAYLPARSDSCVLLGRVRCFPGRFGPRQPSATPGKLAWASVPEYTLSDTTFFRIAN